MTDRVVISYVNDRIGQSFVSKMCYNMIVHSLLLGSPPLKKVIPLVIITACLVFVATLLPSRAGQAQQENQAQYFPETGHYVREPFLSFFETKGGVQAWGPPITEAIEEKGHLVQYFRRARMECLTQTQGPCEVELSPLGELLGHRTPRMAPVPQSLIEDGLCRYFALTGHNVCFSFLAFYLDRGGSDVFGAPISELRVEPGMITQYFQRARIEWHTAAPAGRSMELGPIGEEYFHAKGLDPALLPATEVTPTPQATVPGITVGDYVEVEDTEGVGLRLRAGPGVSHEMIRIVEDGSILRVVGGPRTADGFTWWHLDYHGSLGWCADEWLKRVDTPYSQ